MTGHRQARAGRQAAIAAMFVLGILLAPMVPVGAWAQPATPAAPDAADGCILASEPNDQPDTAADLGSGAACGGGQYPGSGQDLYRWTVAEADTTSRWSLMLSALPNQVGLIEVYDVELDDAGTIVAATKLLSVMGDAGTDTTIPNLLWSPGAYYIGVAYSGPGAYRLDIGAGDPVPDDTPITDAPASVTDAFDLAVVPSEPQAAVTWTVSSSTDRFDMHLQGPVAAPLSWDILDAAGATRFTGATAADGVATVPDVGLEPGAYTIAVRGGGESPVRWILAAAPATTRAEPAEREPNEAPITATAIEFDGDAAVIGGRLATVPVQNDLDHYRLTVEAEHAGRLTDVRLLWTGGPARELCLLDATDAELRCVTGEGGLALNDLVLPAGDYTLQVSGVPDPAASYLLRVDVTGELAAGFEAEPNDSILQASALAPDGDGFASAGRLQGTDYDTFRFTVAGEPQLWRIEAEGPAIGDVSQLDAVGRTVAKAPATDGRATIHDAFLLPGDHAVAVAGSGGDYTVQVTPLGPPDPLFEREPNDSLDRSQPLLMLEERTGRLASATDVDFYRFSLQNDTFVELTVGVPDGGSFRLALDQDAVEVVDVRSPGPGERLAWRGMLQPGDYAIRLTALTPADGPYTIQLAPLNPFDTPSDLEPNGSQALAAPMPASMSLSGLIDPLSERGDTDWFLMPALDVATDVTVAYTPEMTIAAETVGDTLNPSTFLTVIPGTEAGGALVQVPADVPWLLQVSGPAGPYGLAVTTAGAPPALGTPIAGTPALTATLNLGNDAPAAYWTTGQAVPGELTLVNSGTSALDLGLATRVGNASWTISFESGTVAVPAGETVTVPFAVHVAPDAWADRPIYIAVAARNDAISASALATIVPNRTAPPLNAEAWSPLPGRLLGGLDVAWSGLGATPVALDEAAALAEAPLYDQLLTTSAGYSADISLGPAELTVDLAGDEPVPVVGIVLFPVGPGGTVDSQLKAFDLELSLDGDLWVPAVTGEVTAQGVEQPFTLDAPVEARFARLRVRSGQGADTTTVSIGEWKVVADPGWQPPGDPVNIGAPALGGHIVSIQPPLPDMTQTQSPLLADDLVQSVPSDGDGAISFVVGFHHNRAAQVTGLEWVDGPAQPWFVAVDTIVVETSVGSPTGPWTRLGEFVLDRTGDRATVEFEAPAWARFVRVTGMPAVSVDPATPGVDPPEIALPGQLHIRERPIGDDYRSILGEWGTDTPNAVYETLTTPVPVTLDDDAAGDRDAATLLAPGDRHTDTAAVEADEDWYRVEVPPGDGVLSATLEGIPALGVTVTLHDDTGREIPVEIEPLTANMIRLTAAVAPGMTCFLHVSQPPTSAIFAFDTSFSIGPLETSVYQGLTRFAGDVLPGREAVDILPFGEGLLLESWIDEPYFLQATIANYGRTSTSSDAEGSLVTANEALAARPGNRAILLITDAENNPSAETMTALWPGLAATAPRIFTVGIAGGADSAHGQDLLQDWSAVNNGRYVYARDQGDLDIAFDRAATELRRPSLYTITAQTTAPQPTPTPEPTATPLPTPTPAADGSLQVLAPPAIDGQPPVIPAAADGQVAIILDTSGSMLQDLDDSPRADIAKAALVDLVTTTIPVGTTVSLRTFGVTPDSCETLLVVPPQPLDGVSMSEVIANLPIVNLVRTPIGASLEAVAGDLGTGDGAQIVVLVTDGEETCGGDAAAAIQGLVASGIDVRVNIVGFAIDDTQLAATFAEWASIGNGQYIDAGNAGELNRAVAQAVLPTFDVVDASGEVVANGQVGAEPIALPPGTYQIIIDSDPAIVLDVVIESGITTEAEVPAS